MTTILNRDFKIIFTDVFGEDLLDRFVENLTTSLKRVLMKKPRKRICYPQRWLETRDEPDCPYTFCPAIMTDKYTTTDLGDELAMEDYIDNPDYKDKWFVPCCRPLKKNKETGELEHYCSIHMRTPGYKSSKAEKLNDKYEELYETKLTLNGDKFGQIDQINGEFVEWYLEKHTKFQKWKEINIQLPCYQEQERESD